MSGNPENGHASRRLSPSSPKPRVAIHTEPNDAQHEEREHRDIEQCVNHTPPTYALPLADNDLTRARKIPFDSGHWSGKIKLDHKPGAFFCVTPVTAPMQVTR